MFLIGAIALTGVLIGAGLGLFFHVFVLVPVALVSVLPAVSVSLAHEYEMQAMVISAIAILIGPQIGYLVGSGIQTFFKARRTPSAVADEPMIEATLARPAE